MRLAQEQQMRDSNKFPTDSQQQQIQSLKRKRVQEERMQEKEVQRRLRDLSFDKYGVAVSGEQALKEA